MGVEHLALGVGSEGGQASQIVDLDIDAIRAKLSDKGGKEYWQSLDEIAETPAFTQWVDDEFAHRETLMSMDRRSFLKVMGASMALAGLAGCRGAFLPEDKLVPYVKAPEELVPGKPLFYATAMSWAGYARGILVEQHEGRPTKIEGNPDHPASLGACDSIGQAAILEFYDPDRSVTPRDRELSSTWATFLKAARAQLEKEKATGGAGLRLLTETVTSPTLRAQISAVLAAYPKAQWHQYDAAANENARVGAVRAFGRAVAPVYQLKNAKVIVSLDSDFLSDDPGSLVYAREFADGRRVKGRSGSMNRLYTFESTPGLAGAMADHRWAMKPSEIAGVASYLFHTLDGREAVAPQGVSAEHLQALVRDLQANKGAAVVIAGPRQGAEVHAAAHAINQSLGAFGKTVRFIPDPAGSEDLGGAISDFGNEKVPKTSLAALQGAIRSGSVKTLLVIDANPAHTATQDAEFSKDMGSIDFTARLGLYDDETSQLCQWHLPKAHFLEAWGDLRAFDGTLSIQQPLIAPLFKGQSAIEFLAALLGDARPGEEILKEHHAKVGTFKGDFAKQWRKALHQGVVDDSAGATVAVSAGASLLDLPVASKDLEVVFHLDPNLMDGRYANNGWLQELPKPFTKLTWDNVAMVSPTTAKELGVKTGNLVDLTLNGQSLEAPIWVQPGQANGVVALALGYGRTRGGAVASGEDKEMVGFNANAIRSSQNPWHQKGIEVRNKGGDYRFASTQTYYVLEGRDVVRAGTLEEFKENPNFVPAEKAEQLEVNRKNDLYPAEVYSKTDGPQWGMTIDLNTCIGCNACVSACQAENNIPVVGKDQVARNREMHWLRIDRYYTNAKDANDPLENPDVIFQPLMCVHCETAPCEPVCPVAATVHSHEGLNQMVYNRCVGTRYCSNNCPYRVRRFNYLNYTDNQLQYKEHSKIPLLKLLNNPNVTVRGRGVMEKCTYCTQRISAARIEAKKANRDIADGDVVTACQQSCPTQAIVFGDITDAKSKVSEWRKDPRSYLLLEQLNTKPRTSHLARLKNPNPEIQPAVQGAK